VFGTPARPDAVLFVDLDTDIADAVACARAVRDLPFGHFIGVTALVARYPAHIDVDDVAVQELCAQMTSLIRDIAPTILRCYVLVQRFGSPAVVYAEGSEPKQVEDELLWRLRAVELAALLESSHAVWRSSDYHFVLPSGSHVSSFVRVADGLNGPRDVHALATWLLPEAAANVGYVFDNRSLTPLALVLESLYQHAGVPLGLISFLEHYPDSQFDVEAAVQEAATGGAGVIGILSVSSGGGTKARLLAAIDRAGHPISQSHLHVLLDRGRRADAMTRELPGSRITTWLGFGTGESDAVNPHECRSCQVDSGRVVAIDPRFFDGMILPRPKLVMLRPNSAREVAPFWEVCDAAGAVAIEHKPAAATKPRRSRPDDKSGVMGVYVSMEKLLNWRAFEATVATGIRQLLNSSDGPTGAAVALTGVDVVVYGHSKALTTSGKKFVAILKRVLKALPEPPSMRSVFDVDVDADAADWNPKVVAALAGSKRVLLVSGSAVSGQTMQKLLIGCQEHLRKADDPQPLTGLMVHSRLETTREWTTLRNSYAHRLFTLFDTPLPPVSPLRDELRTLATMRRDVRKVGAEWHQLLTDFMTRRAAVCAGSGVAITATKPAPYVPLLWGTPAVDEPRAHIRQHSLFGHKLGSAAYFAAIGSAVHRERQRMADEPGPVWHLFEMPALLRSYYDPLIIASMLRWLSPAEIWWGEDVAMQAVVELFERTSVDDKRVLVPEFLLAAAHGKVPEDAGEHIAQVAMSLLARPPASYRLEDVVALAAGLLAWWAEQQSRLRLSDASFPNLPPVPTRMKKQVAALLRSTNGTAGATNSPGS